MTRAALEHLLRAAAAITDEREFVVIGSQAILGQFPQAPPALLVSMEADLYPRHAPEKSDLIDGAIGELSVFPQQYGYYAHGVDDTTATLPEGWQASADLLHQRLGELPLAADRVDALRGRLPGTVRPRCQPRAVARSGGALPGPGVGGEHRANSAGVLPDSSLTMNRRRLTLM